MGDVACGRAGRLERACARREAGRGGPVLPQTGLPMCTSGSIRPCPLGLRHHLLHGVHRCALPLCATPNLACHGDSWRASGSCPPPLPPPARSPNAFQKDPSRSNPLSCCPTTPAEAYAGSFRKPRSSPRCEARRAGPLQTYACCAPSQNDGQADRQTDRQTEAAACRRPAAGPGHAFCCAEARRAAVAGERRC